MILGKDCQKIEQEKGKNHKIVRFLIYEPLKSWLVHKLQYAPYNSKILIG